MAAFLGPGEQAMGRMFLFQRVALMACLSLPENHLDFRVFNKHFLGLQDLHPGQCQDTT